MDQLMSVLFGVWEMECYCLALMEILYDCPLPPRRTDYYLGTMPAPDVVGRALTKEVHVVDDYGLDYHAPPALVTNISVPDYVRH
jgi:hypothetical protein